MAVILKDSSIPFRYPFNSSAVIISIEIVFVQSIHQLRSRLGKPLIIRKHRKISLGIVCCIAPPGKRPVYVCACVSVYIIQGTHPTRSTQHTTRISSDDFFTFRFPFGSLNLNENDNDKNATRTSNNNWNGSSNDRGAKRSETTTTFTSENHSKYLKPYPRLKTCPRHINMK